MGMDRKRYEELVRGNNRAYKDFSQGIYIKRFERFQNVDGVRGGMCRALAAAYIAKNHAKALAKSGATEDDFITADFTRDLMTAKFFSALAMGRPSVTVKTISAWETQVQQQHARRLLS